MATTSAETAAAWQSTASGRAELRLSTAAPEKPDSLCMDFDFKDGGGFVVARRAMRRAMPAEYALRFRLKGRGPQNDLELKLVDVAGQNVWRCVFKALALPARWRRVTVTSREIEFAWGPSSGRSISELGSIEFAVVAGPGGRGRICIEDLEVMDLLPLEPPQASASSAGAEHAAAGVLNGRGWQPAGSDHRPWITLDLMGERTLGGLIVDWGGEAPPKGFHVRVSNTGRRWKTVYRADAAGGKRSYICLPAVRGRLLRLQLHGPAAVRTLQPQSFDYSRSLETFWNNVADAEPRGFLPRWLHREQTLWTPVGTSHGEQCGLMNADGMVEPAEGSASIEPFLRVGGRLFTWADVAARQELADGMLPAPSCIWETAAWRLTITAEATVAGAVRVRYRLENLGIAPLAAHLYVAVRPFQVTPPWQKFRGLGGVRQIHSLAWRDQIVHIDDSLRIAAADAAGFGGVCFDDGLLAARLADGALPAAAGVLDRFGFASGALDFPLDLPGQGVAERVVECAPGTKAPVAGGAAFDWRAQLPLDQWSGNGWIGDAIEAAMTATAHVLVTRSGAALQPGPRRYTRSWIRDGAMMSAALLRMGHAGAVKDYIDWYAPHQRADGFVPCCVDREGIDWLVEHDSHGQLLALIADHHRFTGDRAFLSTQWPFVERAAAFIEGALDATGLLPVSVSHEGYLAQPVHSYWDDFWALKGLGDAVDLATVLGHRDAAQRWAALSVRFAAALFASIEDTRAQRRLDFIPGSIEWADFDPTATANALYLLDVPEGLNREAVDRTFDRYLSDWRAKRGGGGAWTNYTPYEIRIIGALVRLGRRADALELLKFFLSDRRPPPWNQWPEIAWRDPAAPAHVGDLPHTWIAAEYVLSVRSLFAYERDAALVIAAGLAPEWLAGEGVRVHRMPTSRGPLSYALRSSDPGTVRFDVERIDCPLVLRPPLPGRLHSVSVNGLAWTRFDHESVTLSGGPAQVVCTAI